jgi:hypothetical protein
MNRLSDLASSQLVVVAAMCVFSCHGYRYIYIYRINTEVSINYYIRFNTLHTKNWVPGGPFPGGKARPGRDADHSPPSSAEVKNG